MSVPLHLCVIFAIIKKKESDRGLTMERHGFIRDMMDVKVLILFVTARSNYPLTVQEIYELCFQDDCLSYFDVCTAVPEMTETGHLEEIEK